MSASPEPRAGAPALRPARDRDLDCVAALYGRLAEHHSLHRFDLAASGEDALRRHLALLLRDVDAALIVEDRLGGFVAARRLERPAFFAERERVEIEGLFVCPTHRGRGLGRALVEAAIAVLDPSGRLPVALSVECGNREGEAFWDALGFPPVMQLRERAPQRRAMELPEARR